MKEKSLQLHYNDSKDSQDAKAALEKAKITFNPVFDNEDNDPWLFVEGEKTRKGLFEINNYIDSRKSVQNVSIH